MSKARVKPNSTGLTRPSSGSSGRSSTFQSFGFVVMPAMPVVRSMAANTSVTQNAVWTATCAPAPRH